MKAVSVLVLFASAAYALQITEPDNGDDWDLSQTNEIEWESVSTDEPEFSLKLIDKRTSPESQITIADKVKTSDGKFDLTNFVAPPGDRYTIKAFSLSKTNSGQLAESQTFNVTKSGVAATSTTAGAPSGTGTAAPGSTTAGRNGAATLSGTFGVVGSVALVFAMLF
ncbi:hypothetical protein B0T14DRAFT_586259 [Immersiella caudata]|uniref:Yeast cell wall synthesis Kre9/Knh1-like N-terminal domain-containing protein n=1 Tax=Immersiella caudata TaxID=314043 RepID=A0AA39WRB0_9PEZI|nr:hypothetical protein B0T14DRAFT_586259 [Immersiella caudata]